MIKHNLRTSTRGYGTNSIEIALVITFTGEGVTESGVVAHAFTEPLRESAEAIAEAARESINQTLLDRETAVREALNAVLDQVDPSQHAAITQRLGVSP